MTAESNFQLTKSGQDGNSCLQGTSEIDPADEKADHAFALKKTISADLPVKCPSEAISLREENNIAPVISALSSLGDFPNEESVSSSEENMLSPVTPSMSNSADFPTKVSKMTGLQRARTLPSGICEDANKERCANGSKGLVRSSTEKGKQSKFEKETLRNVALYKLSNRKKKLIKRMATVTKDGCVEFDASYFAPDLFGPNLEPTEATSFEGDEDDEKKVVPPLQIAMLIVGTRGDVQPFVAIGKRLQEYGHRVRLATHSNFQDFVLKAGLEFFPLGGDPKVLAHYMVKNKGFLPSGPSEITTQRKQIKAIIRSLLPACTEAYETGVAFRAQAVIANPPAYGQVHVAEYLKVPLHIFFTMPWTPTSEFPHPLSRVKTPATYRISYQVVDSLIWLGIRGMINDFRKKKLKLRPITYFSGSLGSISNYPTGYIWSPHLVPKPKDWGKNIDVVGFCFLNLTKDYKPPEQLANWLQDGKPPIYVGFGSMPVEDPKRVTNIIVEALRTTGQRGIIDKGWGGIGNLQETPEFVFLLENCPHDWLFPRCAAVVHHGGAGTTAAGLKAACPTTIVPFFGDQPFWGERVHAKGVGPVPIPVEQFSLDKLVNAINFMLNPEVKQRALNLAKAMEGEDGVSGAVAAFHKHLPNEMPVDVQLSSPNYFHVYLSKFKERTCCVISQKKGNW